MSICRAHPSALNDGDCIDCLREEACKQTSLALDRLSSIKDITAKWMASQAEMDILRRKLEAAEWGMEHSVFLLDAEEKITSRETKRANAAEKRVRQLEAVFEKMLEPANDLSYWASKEDRDKYWSKRALRNNRLASAVLRKRRKS